MSRHHCVGLGIAAFAAIVGLIGPATASAQTAAAPTFTKDVAPIFQAKCEACHRADGMAPMSLVDLRRGAALGEVDRDRVGDAPDAAVAHRQDGRHPEVQERSLAERRADRDHPRVGRRRRAEGRSEGHAARRRSGPTKPSRGTWPTKYGEPDLVVKSPDYTMPRGRAGRVVAADVADRPHRTALGPRDRHPSLSVKGRKITHHALARSCASTEDDGHGALHQRSRTSPATASSWNGRSARTATRCVPTRAA